MNETTLTVTGHITADVELRFLPSGTPVANFTVATNARRFDKTSDTWVDAEPVFMRCSAWRQLAENAAESFRRGDRVIVVGTLRTNSYQTREGEQRSSIELTVTDMGASVQFAQVKVAKLARVGSATASDQPLDTDRPPV